MSAVSIPWSVNLEATLQSRFSHNAVASNKMLVLMRYHFIHFSNTSFIGIDESKKLFVTVV